MNRRLLAGFAIILCVGVVWKVRTSVRMVGGLSTKSVSDLTSHNVHSDAQAIMQDVTNRIGKAKDVIREPDATNISESLEELLAEDPRPSTVRFAERCSSTVLLRGEGISLETSCSLLSHLSLDRGTDATAAWRSRRRQYVTLWARTLKRCNGTPQETQAGGDGAIAPGLPFSQEAEITIVHAYAQVPYDNVELEFILKECDIDETTRVRILRTVDEIIG